MSNYSVFDITIWEQIRSVVEVKTHTLVQEINREISNDRSLRDYQAMYPVPWQMKQVMLQRANGWIQRLYELCCEAYKRSGKDVSVDFERAIWAYWIEPFIMGERDSAGSGYKVSKLLELLFCAAGLPPEKRNQLKVGQRDCCLNVRNEMLFSWQQKLLRLAQRLDEQTRWGPVGPSQLRTTPTTPEPPPQLPISASTVSQTKVPVFPQAPVVPQSSAAAQPPVDLQATASADAERRVLAPSVPAPRYSGATDWQAIEIVFLSDHRVQIRINGKQTQPANYAELGFADGRSENPNKAWLTLRLLAENRGVIKDGRSIGEPWTKVEKRIQEIRRALRELFGISTDPLPFVEGAGYQAIFKIRCGPSFHT
jgi:hypothetical protein